MFKHRKSGHKILIFTSLAVLLSMIISGSLFVGPVHKAQAAADYQYNDSKNLTIKGLEGLYSNAGEHAGTYIFKNSFVVDTITITNGPGGSPSGKNGGPDGILSKAPDGTKTNIKIAPYSSTGPKTVSGTFVNHSRIDIGSTIFFDAKIDDSLNFYETNGANDCENQSVIQGFHHLGADTTNGSDTVDYDQYSEVNGSCQRNAIKVKLSNPGNCQSTGFSCYEIYFLWVTSGEITTSDHGHSFIADNPDPNGPDSPYNGDGTNDGLTGVSCPDSLTGPVGAYTMTWVATDGDSLHEGWPADIGSPPVHQVGNCSYSNGTSVAVGDQPNSALPPNTGPTGDCSTTGNCGGDLNATCEARFNNPLSWFLCPVFNGVAGMSDWLYTQFIVPFLRSTPISTVDSSTNVSFKVWSSFRIYGNIVLIITILIMVLGQAIGGGAVDAYTIKKVMPRILIAALLVNLSIYIMAFMTDATNIVGRGMQQLIWAPLQAAGATKFQLGGAASFGSVGVAALASFLGAASLGGIITGLAFGHTFFISKAMLFIMFAVIIPVILAIVGVFATLIIRRGILIFLVIISPVAFALYCLPNTEQYFRRWWSLYIKTLLVYPIVVLIFAMADVLTVTILLANHVGGVAGTVNDIIVAVTAFVIQFLPLAMVPFAFRLSGGAMQAVFGGIKGGLGRVGDMTKERKEWAQKAYHDETIANRVKGTERLGAIQNRGSKSRVGKFLQATALGRGTAGFLSSRLQGYNLDLADAQAQAARNKEADEQIATGDEAAIRGLLTSEELFQTAKKGGVAGLLAHGYEEGKNFKQDADGGISLANASGAFNKLDKVAEGKSRYGKNRYMVQRVFAREIEKALVQGNDDALAGNIVSMQRDFGFDDDTMNRVLIGAGFQTKGKSLQWKRYTVANNDDGTPLRSTDGKEEYQPGEKYLKLDGSGLSDEVHAQLGTYAGMAQDQDTWTTLASTYLESLKAMDKAQAEVATATTTKGRQDAQERYNGAAQAAQKIKETAGQFKGMTRAQITENVRRGAMEGGDQAVVGAAPDIALTIQELMDTVDTGKMVEGGKLSTRDRREVIKFNPTSTPVIRPAEKVPTPVADTTSESEEKSKLIVPGDDDFPKGGMPPGSLPRG